MIHIIEKVIKNDILNELLKNYEKYNGISIEEYIQFCENRIDIYIKHSEVNSSFIDKMCATYACKAAIKAGEKLEGQEIKHLINRLFMTKNPYFCPHGRPIIINFTEDELDERFERK